MTVRCDDHAVDDSLPLLPLQRKPSPAPSPALRDRVLEAVDAVLAADPTAPSADGTRWMAAAALLVAGLVTPPWLMAADATNALERAAPASLGARVRAAGFADVLPPAEPPALNARLASSPPSVDDVRLAPLRPDPIVFRRLLEGEL